MDPKQLLREEALANRRREPGRAAKSAAIGEHIETLEACRTATLIASYVGIRDEVATRPFLERRLTQDLPTAVVYRDGGTLGLCRIHTLDELEQASFGLWEPPDDLRRDPGRSCSASDVSLFLVPGLAFDRDGGRLGYGRGYYDSLLVRAHPQANLLGLAFESQIVPRVPMTDRDVPMHAIATELGVSPVDR